MSEPESTRVEWINAPPAGPGELVPPCRLGDFVLMAELGRGGMGTVYKARHLNLDREVALKIVLPEVAAQRGYAERFLREARAAARITHPHVIRVHDVREIDGRLVMSLELVSGGDAARLIRDQGGKVPETRALEIVRDCARGLVALEEAGMVHRDIKPANVFLGANGEAKLADLGLAREAGPGAERLTHTGMVVGTPAYMSPEQANGRTDIDVRSDIHALGGTLYELLTGVQPYRGKTPMAILTKILTGPVPDPREKVPALSEATSALVRKALAKDRGRRYQTATELLRALERALAQLHGQPERPAAAKPAAPAAPAAPRPEPRPAPAGGPARRLPLVPLLLAPGIPLLAGLGVVVVRGLGSAPPEVADPPPAVAEEVPEAPEAEEPPLVPEPLGPGAVWRGGPGMAELRPRELPRRPAAEVPWTFPPRAEWTTTADRIVVRGRSTGRVLAVSGDGVPTTAAAEDDGRFALTLLLEPGRNQFQLRLGDGSAAALVVERVTPTAAAEWKRQFVARTDLVARTQLVRSLDLSTLEGRELALDFVFKLLEADLREAGIDHLAAEPPEALTWIPEALGPRAEPLAAEAILTALGRSGDPRWVPAIVPHLATRKTIVVDAAVRALGRLGTAEGVAALTSASTRLSHPEARVTRALRESLLQLGLPVTPAPPEEALEAYSAGVRLLVRIRGRGAGRGGPAVVVLVPPGLSADLFVPYLAFLEPLHPVVYVELPGRDGLPRELGDVYPVELLADALEDLRVALTASRRLRDKPLFLVAHGLAGWVSMSYTAKRPRQVRRQVLFGVPGSRKAWDEGLNRVERAAREAGDAEGEKAVRETRRQLLAPTGRPDLGARTFSLLFADRRDLEILRARGPLVVGDGGLRPLVVGDGGLRPLVVGPRWWVHRPPGGELALPDFDLALLPRTLTSTLVVRGGQSAFSSEADAEAIARHYQAAGRVSVYKGSDRAPWIEQEEELFQELLQFFGSAR